MTPAPSQAQRLSQSRVLIVGAGGLGCPAAWHLAAAGVGRIGVVDLDRVDLSNLQRQILYTTADVGALKAEQARQRLQALNPAVSVVAHPVRLGADNASRLVRQYDLVIDGVDNFAARYLVGDACYLAGIPLIEAGILRWTGMVMTIAPGSDGPCYRCLFPQPPPAGAVPSCAQAGVIGALAGAIGSLQATEAIKLLLGAGEPLVGRVLQYDALSGRIRVSPWGRRPGCSLCGDRPTITSVSEYPQT